MHAHSQVYHLRHLHASINFLRQPISLATLFVSLPVSEEEASDVASRVETYFVEPDSGGQAALFWPAAVHVRCLSELALQLPAGVMTERSETEQDAALGACQQRRPARRSRPASAEDASDRHKLQKFGYSFGFDTPSANPERLCLLCCEPIKVTHQTHAAFFSICAI